MIGSPAIFRFGNPFEVVDRIVGNVPVFMVAFEGNAIFTDRSRSLEGKEDDDMAIGITKFTHVRIIITTFAVMAMSTRGSHTDREMVEYFSESASKEREEMAITI